MTRWTDGVQPTEVRLRVTGACVLLVGLGCLALVVVGLRRGGFEGIFGALALVVGAGISLAIGVGAFVEAGRVRDDPTDHQAS